MMRKTLLAGAVAPGLLAGADHASAQAVVVEAPPPAAYVVPAVPPAPTYYYHYYSAPPPAPVVRYYRYHIDPDDYDQVVVVRPRVRGCGPGYRWTGEGCAYARW